jgi:hypothetical protein
LYARYFGGDLHLQSMPGHGTNVYVNLNHLGTYQVLNPNSVLRDAGSGFSNGNGYHGGNGHGGSPNGYGSPNGNGYGNYSEANGANSKTAHYAATPLSNGNGPEYGSYVAPGLDGNGSFANNSPFGYHADAPFDRGFPGRGGPKKFF